MPDGGLQGPDAGAFLAGFVEDDVDQRFPGLGIFLAKDLRRDVDQVAVEIASVPFRKDVGQFVRC